MVKLSAMLEHTCPAEENKVMKPFVCSMGLEVAHMNEQ